MEHELKVRELELLDDRLRWNAASVREQNRAIKIIESMLAPAFSWLGTEEYECQNLSHRIATFRHESSSAELNLIPGGFFFMGTNQGNPDERPVHEVTLPPFLIGRTPLTQECWDLIGGVDDRPWSELELPISGLSWHQTQSWLRRAGDKLRLPSEAEWEYACRAGSTSQYFWGEAMDPSYCWYGGNAFSSFQTHPPWEHEDKPNAFGLIDVSGNVFEWCEDEWFADYHDAPHDERPRLGQRGRALRVLRGGSWDDHCDHCASAFRFKAQPAESNSDYGLRLALSLPFGPSR